MAELARAWVQGRQARGEITRRSATVELSRLQTLVVVNGGRPVIELDRATLLAWQASIGYRAPATRRAYLSTVGGFCRWLVAEGHLTSDPTVDLARVREPRRVPRALAHEDVGRILTACQDERARAVVWLMVGCGLRCIEVSNLDVHDYDPVVRTIQVSGKGGHERVLPTPVAVAGSLDAYLAAGRGGRAGPLVRPDPRGKWSPTGRVSAARVSALVRRIMVDAGVHSPGDGRSAHALRHTAASDVLDACHDIRAVQQMLGHQSMATTQVYLRRADLGRLREAMEGRDYRAVA